MVLTSSSPMVGTIFKYSDFTLFREFRKFGCEKCLPCHTQFIVAAFEGASSSVSHSFTDAKVAGALKILL